jgi:hypothetical protein
MATLEELEETAKLFFLKKSATDSLTEVQLNELRTAFAVRW